MKKVKFFNYVEKKDSQKLLDLRIDYDALKKTKGGMLNQSLNCDPWTSCDAWNCAPDCTCKGLA